MMEKIALKACNGKFVCAENAGNSPLIANREKVGEWETFSLVEIKRNTFALVACNGKYVCAERKGSDTLIANRDKRGNWETFEWVAKGNKKAIKAKCNDKYVCAESGGAKALIANRSNLGAWESFEIIQVESESLKAVSKKAKSLVQEGAKELNKTTARTTAQNETSVKKLNEDEGLAQNQFMKGV